MTQEEQQIAIAEACGWKWFTNPEAINQCRWLGSPQYKPWSGAIVKTSNMDLPLSKTPSEELPEYLYDLNAMHEAEKIIEEKFDFYRETLALIVGQYAVIFHATASQRAKAFLITIGKWKE